MSASKTKHHLPLMQELPRKLAEAGAVVHATGPVADSATLLVGDLARATGKTVRALHLYENLGLVRPEERSKGRYRLYAREAVLRVRWITKLQNLGLSLSDIQDLVREQEDSGSAVFAAAKLRDVYRQKLDETRQKLLELSELERELEESLSYLESCDSACVPEEKTASCSSCSRHTDQKETPELVAGVRVH